MDSSLVPSSRDSAVSAAERNAIFYAPINPFVHKQPPVPLHAFEDERRALLDGAPGTRVIALDLGGAMGLPYAATTPNMLARYVIVARDEALSLRLNAVVAIHYVMKGSGHSDCHGTRIEWKAGDVFLLPGGGDALHVAGEGGAGLYVVTDEPMLSFAGTMAPAAEDAKVAPTYFAASEIDLHLAMIHAREDHGAEAAKSVWFVCRQMAGLRTTSPSLSANLNTLGAGKDQRSHRHNAAAITLSIAGEGVHSMVAGRRSDWRPWSVMVTPPGAPHSHHNRGRDTMRSFVVQDSGLHYYSRTTGFRFDDGDGPPHASR